MKPIPHLVQTGLWQWIKSTGLERFELLQLADEWILRGTILVLAEGGLAEARYHVVCDERWTTRRANISIRDKSGERIVQIITENSRWLVNGRADEALAGCTDIDLEWSPSTNTIPIRRLGLAIGKKSCLVTAAWVRFPNLTIQPLLQEYERTSLSCYRYASGGGAFSADLTVDDEGLVLNYGGVWERVLTSRAE